MSDMARNMGFKHHRVTPEDPQSNGFAESFVKVMVKFVHTTLAEGKNPKRELQNYLLHYRATPHSSTGISPAEALFSCKLRTRIPQISNHSDSSVQKQMGVHHDKKEDQQKKYFDKGHRATQKTVKPGDKILVQQKKTTTSPPFDPKPYSVTAVKGNRVTSERNGQTRVRSKNHIKVVPERPLHLIPKKNVRQQQSNPTAYDYDTDISHIIGNVSTSETEQQNDTLTLDTPPDNAEISNIQEAIAETTVVLEAEPSTSADGAISTTLFRLEEEERRNMEQLFQNALLSVGSRERNADIDILQEQSNSNSEGEEEEMKDKLRSSKRTLQNPEMNGDTVVIESN